MEVTSLRHASSAGYRLQPRTTVIRPKSSLLGTAQKLHAQGDTTLEGPRDKIQKDPAKQDQVWRELVRNERRGLKEWKKNWDFLLNCDQMGKPKPKTPLPSYGPLFSDHVPITSNQIFSSRLSTPMGKSLIRLEKLLFMSSSNQRRKRDPEMLPG